jgi:hypothetical protein
MAGERGCGQAGLMVELSYRLHRFPPAVIQHAFRLYLRFTLSYRDGSPDDMKFRSCMTLFSLAIEDPGQSVSSCSGSLVQRAADEQTLAFINARRLSFLPV